MSTVCNRRDTCSRSIGDGIQSRVSRTRQRQESVDMTRAAVSQRRGPGGGIPGVARSRQRILACRTPAARSLGGIRANSVGSTAPGLCGPAHPARGSSVGGMSLFVYSLLDVVGWMSWAGCRGLDSVSGMWSAESSRPHSVHRLRGGRVARCGSGRPGCGARFLCHARRRQPAVRPGWVGRSRWPGGWAGPAVRVWTG